MQIAKELLNKLRVYKRRADINPHKYLLLLSIITIFKENINHDNRFTFNELEPIFLSHFNNLFPDVPNYRKVLEYPFYHLQSDGFWHLQVKEGKEAIYRMYKSSRMTKKRLLETVDYAYLDNDVYELMRYKESRELLENEILNLLCGEYYFSAENDTDGIVVKERNSLFEYEQSAIEIINNNILSQHIGKLVNNVSLHDTQSNNYYEYDVILVTHSGIYVVELKHWSGHIRIAPYNWEINGTHYRTDPHKNNSFKCKVLKGIYQHHFRTYPDVWVESVVVLTNNEAIVEGASAPGLAAERDMHNPTFASISDFITYLKKKESSTSRSLLDDTQIDAIINYLKSLNTPRPSLKYCIPGYETLEYISQKPECIELIARPIDGRAKGLSRFRVFRIPNQAVPEEKERFIRKAWNTLDAVSRIGDHPHIHKVWVMRNEDGDIIEGSEWSETGTLRDQIRQQKGAFPVDTTLRICRGIALALNRAHQAGVIHRAVKPENILMMNGIPKLINFDLAYQIEEVHVTVMPDVSKIKDDGYIAPEILAGQDIDEGTDFFSLGVIAYEMLTGARPFASVRAFIAQGGLLNEQARQKLTETGAPDEVIEAIMGMVIADRVRRLKDGEKIIAAFSLDTEGSRKGTDPVAVNPRLQPGEQYDVYEILELIGEGAEAQIYRAKTIRSEEVVLKLFNKEIPRERIFKEAEITSAVDSTYVVHCDNRIGHWKNDRFFLVLDYIEGESMRKMIDRNERPDLETFRTVALCLMEAVEAFHEHKDRNGTPRPLLHSDIKPDNILITKDRKAVLIDCGIAGEPRVDVFQGTFGYVPPDSISGTDRLFSQDGDLFALGVTLWEWLFGTKPYNNPAIGDNPQIPETLGDDVQEYLPWLMKAVATEASKRFTTIKEMRESFIGLKKIKEESAELVEKECATGLDSAQKLETSLANKIVGVEQTEEVTEQLLPVNPFVTYLNSLSNASAFNENATAESQLGNPFFARIFVANPLADFIYEKLISEHRNVILTGNAGDGKTTIAAEIFKKVTGEFRLLQPREDIAASNLVIIKDMSELPEDNRIEVLMEAVGSQKNSYLIVSNTGTLLESFRKLKVNGRKTDESELLKALEADTPQSVLDGRFLIVNIGRMDSIKTACDVFKRMLDPANWLPNKNCQYREYCPIFRNVKLLQENLDVVCERVMLLYRRLYEYNVRLTMRQMTGHLAYAITAGRSCAEIGAMSLIALQDCLCGSLFFNRFFGDDGNNVAAEAMQLLPVRRIREAEFGVVLASSFERKVWMREGKALPLTGEALPIYQKLLDELNRDGPAARRQLRRLVYFFGSLDDEAGKRYISIFLRSPMLIKFLEFSQGASRIPPPLERNYRLRILQVLQEYFIGVRLPEEIWQAKDLYITLKRHRGGARTQMVLADFRVDDFELTVKPRYQAGEKSSGVFCLRFKQGDVEMELDLPFLDYVARRYEGDVAEELSAYYADRLERFKVELMHLYNENRKQHDQQHLQLLRVGPDRRFQVMKVLVSDASLEVLL
ncbi:protein kinase domain-containing protein [Desulfofundulus thermosubterraneus]|uniref:Serine/threonine protein kinase n=1 Tax=Desulfofundulus thermosubterraneus DSM 16057 TaxID=1121432 RepID=A0A1M6E0S9_9FIRM|nr:protein kinase [Desulfofundulus thermosubterraneus]SHI78995.1 Serine/threonine protein kinase [Desulfofundulus thermosubterraneus DSM 16057]